MKLPNRLEGSVIGAITVSITAAMIASDLWAVIVLYVFAAGLITAWLVLVFVSSTAATDSADQIRDTSNHIGLFSGLMLFGLFLTQQLEGLAILAGIGVFFFGYLFGVVPASYKLGESVGDGIRRLKS